MLYRNVSGTWKAFAPVVNVGGTWKDIKEAHVNVAGVWKQIFNIQVQALNISDIRPSSARASVAFAIDGFCRSSTFSGGSVDEYSWRGSPITADHGTLYEIRATLNSGTTPIGGVLNTWQTLTSARSWALDVSGSEPPESCSLTIEIRRAGGNVLASNVVTLYAEQT